MSETPRRKRFQIHLSTAMVMMIVAGVLIWANVTPRDELFYHTHSKNRLEKAFGWPYAAVSQQIIEVYDGSIVLASNIDFDSQRAKYVPQPPNYKIYYWATAVDVAFGLIVLIVVGLLCEWWIRWRAVRS